MDKDLRPDHHSSPRITIACDRCRVKKIKCDGRRPCDHCSEANADCIFRQTRSTRRSYPRGYAEMLEEQQSQMVDGLQELYRRSVDGEGWPGAPLQPEGDGQPLTHDLLSRLGVLDLDRYREATGDQHDDMSNQMVARNPNPNESSGEGPSAILSVSELQHASFHLDQSTFAPLISTMGCQPGQSQLLAQPSGSSTVLPTSNPPSLTYDMTMDPQSLQNISSYTPALDQPMTGPIPEWIMDIIDNDEALHLPESQLSRDP